VNQPPNRSPMNQTEDDAHASLAAAGRAASVNDEGPVRLLLVSARPEWRESVKRALARAGMTCSGVGTLAAAEQRINAWASAAENSTAAFDVVMAESALSDGRGVDLAGLAQGGGMSLILAGSGLSVDDAVTALRAGAADIVPVELRGSELIERVATAATRAREGRRQRGRIVKLKRMCRRLNTAREQVARQVDTLCTDLVQAYQELADHMNQVTTATEFKGLIRNELDIESLLRTTLEFVLSRSGPTNAAIFLPTTSGDYSLGAYVNYDCPRDTVDILLDQLANVVAPRFEHTHGLVVLNEREELDRYIGEDAQWLDGSGVTAMACRHGGETLAVFMLFRDRRNVYSGSLLEQVKTIGELFASQLARVIHIHHRHLPKDKWGMLGDPEHGADGYDDLAA
jgi:DNA-binding response OmpR family regulator